MYPFLLVVVTILIFVLLLPLSPLLAWLFLVLGIVLVPALIIHRREVMIGIEMGPEHERESHGRGILRMSATLGMDTTGIALGALSLILIALFVRFLAGMVR